MKNREFDIVIWGATGFTGKLVVEYLIESYGIKGDLRWAIAGRNKDKLDSVNQALGNGSIPTIQADSQNRESLDAMTARTRVVCSTVGPYAIYGTPLVESCIENGADYCDLTGEVQWMRKIIDTYQDLAKKSGVRIVHTCGFDSIPSDMGVYYTQKMALASKGEYCGHIKFRLKAAKGGMSGGTFASLSNVLSEAEEDKSIYQVLLDPYALNPPGEREGPDQRDLTTVEYDRDAGTFIGPFIMAGINTKVVRRSHALAGFPYGKDFRYDEAIMTGKGIPGRMKGYVTLLGSGLMMLGKPGTLMGNLVARFLPKPGEGPSRKLRESGFYKIIFIGKFNDGSILKTVVTGDRDPGYGSTSKMLSECAICLALDKDKTPDSAGILTPSVAMGDVLLERLQTNAGLSFSVLE